jgi:hypothetical protein
MIDEIYSVVNTILNKENDGYVSPSEYNDLCKLVQDEIFRSYTEDINRDYNRANRGFTNEGYANLVNVQLQRLEPFMKSADIVYDIGDGTYLLPGDMYLIDEAGVITNSGRVIERVDAHQINYIQRSTSPPTSLFPVYYIQGDKFRILPSDYTSPVTISYLKKPTDPIWAYNIIGSGDAVYNESASTDFELHPSEFPNIVVRMLAYFGINLREGEVIQVAESLKNQRDVKEES